MKKVKLTKQKEEISLLVKVDLLLKSIKRMIVK